MIGGPIKPSGILSCAGELSETAISRLKEFWETAARGPVNSGKTLILDGEIKITPMVEQVAICSDCGAPGQGRVCEYCGTRRY